jgi:hypothetical protein
MKTRLKARWYRDAACDQLGMQTGPFQIGHLLGYRAGEVETSCHIRHGANVDIMSRWREQGPGNNQYDGIHHDPNRFGAPSHWSGLCIDRG